MGPRDGLPDLRRFMRPLNLKGVVSPEEASQQQEAVSLPTPISANLLEDRNSVVLIATELEVSRPRGHLNELGPPMSTI
eukprot:31652-Alexandrium_andersonii.AAC.1